MERLLGWKFWAFTVTGYVFSALTVGQTFYDWLGRIGIDSLPAFEKLAPMFFGGIFFVVFLKPVWRRIWRCPVIGAWLSRKVFPDLNGDWDVVMSSNWDRIDRMKNAAEKAALPRYDAEKDYVDVPLKAVSTFKKAIIDQGWGGVTMTLIPKSKNPDDDAKAEESITIAFDLLRDRVGQSQLAYLYVQKNKMDNLATTDVPEVLGAALLTVVEVENEPLKLKGTYFTARSWVQGLNTAGILALTKQPEKSANRVPAHNGEVTSSQT